MSAVSLSISWSDLFTGYTPEDRKARWEEWKRLCIAHDGNTERVDEFQDIEQCDCCEHSSDDWCLYANLPCLVNPILTFQGLGFGMACQGVGFHGRQLELF